MNQLQLPYRIGKPPRALRKARLDNIALVPASLLPRKGKYQTIANHLPKGGVLICQTEKKQRISRILEQVAKWLQANGHVVRTFPSSLIETQSKYDTRYWQLTGDLAGDALSVCAAAHRQSVSCGLGGSAHLQTLAG